MEIARPDIYGWFDHPTQTTPAHDPGPQGLCPVCCHPTGKHGTDNPLKTISMAVEDPKRRDRSYFFRAHKNCWGMATPHEKSLIESAVIDRAHDAAPEMTDRIRELEDALSEIYHQTSTTERQSEIIEAALRLKPNDKTQAPL